MKLFGSHSFINWRRFLGSLICPTYELIPLFVTIDFIKETNDMSQIGRLFETLQLKLTPKDKRKVLMERFNA